MTDEKPNTKTDSQDIVLRLSLNVGPEIRNEIRTAIEGEVRGILRDKELMSEQIRVEVGRIIKSRFPESSDIISVCKDIIRGLLREYIQTHREELDATIKETMASFVPAMTNKIIDLKANQIISTPEINVWLEAAVKRGMKAHLDKISNAILAESDNRT